MFPQQSADRAAYATSSDIEAGHVTGVGYAVSVETGKPIPVYMNDAPPPLPPVPAPVVPPVIVQQPRQVDPVTARIAAASAGAVGTAAVVGHYAHQLAELMHVAEGAAVVVGAAAVGVALLRGSSPKVTVNIANSNTGSSSTASSSSSARSVSGWKNNG